MKRELIERYHAAFEQATLIEDGVEFWSARDIMVLLEYSKWENFIAVVEKAKISCKNNGQNVADHFPDVRKMVPVGSGAQREVEDILLTRYASYLIAQNADPRKPIVAFAQSYFAVQTRKMEVLEERLAIVERLQARKKLAETEKELSQLIYERGVDQEGFGRIRSKGDSALFGGPGTAEMKRKLGVPDDRPLADFLPTITIKAKDFAAEITNFNTNKDDLHGEPSITGEHIKNNQEVRDLLVKRGIKPEELPPAEDIKKIERKVKKEEKKIPKK